MPCIADINVLLPLLCRGHLAEARAYEWFERQPSHSIGWCLPIRLGILRHLSNPHIMGDSVPTPTQALDAWTMLERDARLFEIEHFPASIDRHLQANVEGAPSSTKLWTDAWLASLAEALGLTMVTFDRGFRKFSLSSLELLQI